MKIKGIWGRERDVNLRPGIQDFIQKRRSVRLQIALTQKGEETTEKFLLLQYFAKASACVMLGPGWI